MKPEIQRLFDRAENLYKKGLITEDQYQDQMRNKEEIELIEQRKASSSFTNGEVEELFFESNKKRENKERL